MPISVVSHHRLSTVFGFQGVDFVRLQVGQQTVDNAKIALECRIQTLLSQQHDSDSGSHTSLQWDPRDALTSSGSLQSPLHSYSLQWTYEAEKQKNRVRLMNY